jgi:hypothetical protein
MSDRVPAKQTGYDPCPWRICDCGESRLPKIHISGILATLRQARMYVNDAFLRGDDPGTVETVLRQVDGVIQELDRMKKPLGRAGLW